MEDLEVKSIDVKYKNTKVNYKYLVTDDAESLDYFGDEGRFYDVPVKKDKPEKKKTELAEDKNAGKVKVIMEMDELNRALSKDCLVVINFGATWCKPCKAYKPKYYEHATTYKNARFYKSDIDDAEEIAEKFNVTSVPTIIFFKGKKKLLTVRGVDDKKIVETIEANI